MEKKQLTLEDIVPAFGMAVYTAFMEKTDYEEFCSGNDHGQIAMYLDLDEEDIDYWFDRAHEAFKFAPMSIWDVPSDEADAIMQKLHSTFNENQTAQMLEDFSDERVRFAHNCLELPGA